MSNAVEGATTGISKYSSNKSVSYTDIGEQRNKKKVPGLDFSNLK